MPTQLYIIINRRKLPTVLNFEINFQKILVLYSHLLVKIAFEIIYEVENEILIIWNVNQFLVTVAQHQGIFSM